MLLSSAFLALALAQPAAQNPFEFKDGERVVWIGNTLVEREQRYGYWEATLLLANKDKKITFRNLGWSGDTVFGEARAGFDDATKGFERLVSLTLELKPTVVIVSYGTNESFEGKAGLPRFEKGMNRLLDALAPSKARFVLMSPLPVEKAPGVADPEFRNQALELYSDAIKGIASERKASFVDLFGRVRKLKGAAGPATFTENGIHLGGKGYDTISRCLLQEDAISQPPSGKEDSYNSLLQAIIAKNQLFFYRWRPQNETYLLGFRKHEQGKNAKEIAEFDPLIEKAEENIQQALKAIK